MITQSGESLDYREIDTPWPPQPIAWRCGSRPSDQSRLRELASTNNDYLVREVTIKDRYGYPRTRKHAAYLLARASEEFARLKTYGVSVAETSWYNLWDERANRARPLARVAVINRARIELPHTGLPQAVNIDLHTRLATYQQSGPEGERLTDIWHSGQYVYGTPRTATQDVPLMPYLVDIEPLFAL